MANKSKEKQGLTLLGRKVTQATKKLEAFPNKAKDRYYRVNLNTDEFTCVCPITGQPDFASVQISYVPDKLILESKSLKLYLWSFREQGVFHEHVVNQILDDVVKVLDPHWCLITGKFRARGGIAITVDAEHVKTAAARELWKNNR
ncbi:MAG: NADPH-dependent 7-cyano-7-deazaguanine reductase QueF [Spirochaetales bacterium]|nr:NADPH-dependent 7-cyano-7-deazaguanine reductase QueF [Spirochaetales bacterium]